MLVSFCWCVINAKINDIIRVICEKNCQIEKIGSLDTFFFLIEIVISET